MLGSAGFAAASARGIRLNESIDARLAGASVLTMFCIAAKSSLSIVSANWICGAAKLRTDRLPVALVWSSDAATLFKLIEFWLKLMFAFLTLSGLVKVGVVMDAFCSTPLP